MFLSQPIEQKNHTSKRPTLFEETIEKMSINNRFRSIIEAARLEHETKIEFF